MQNSKRGKVKVPPLFWQKNREFRGVHEFMLMTNPLIYKEKTTDWGYLNSYLRAGSLVA
jgi:hypothetical protein